MPQRKQAGLLAQAFEVLGEIELKPLIAQALHMGDEVHNRNAAASSLLLKRLVPAMLRSGAATADVAAAVEFIAGNDHFFLNISMACAKAMLDGFRCRSRGCRTRRRCGTSP